MIYFICFLTFILLVVIGILVKEKSMEHYANHRITGPMDRPSYSPSCFYYNIDKQNQELYGVMSNTATKLDKEIDRSLNLNKRYTDVANENDQKLKTFMSGQIVKGTKDNLSMASQVLAKALTDNKFEPNISQLYVFNESEIEKTVQTAIELYLNNVVNKALRDANINFDQYVLNSFTNELTNKIATPIYNMFLTKFNQNSSKDIVEILRNIISKMDVAKNVKMLIENGINNDEQLKLASDSARNLKVELGDFVYFRHKLNNAHQFICADDSTQYDIIVGGKVCSVNNANKTVRISYNFVMNPNRNLRCEGKDNIPFGKINYDSGPDGLPKWYPTSKTADCGFGVPTDLACEPKQWSPKDDDWVKNWIGGFDRKNNKMSCGVSPTGYQLPIDVPIAVLSKNLNKLILECKQELKLI
jgi:hypothetical protein